MKTYYIIGKAKTTHYGHKRGNLQESNHRKYDDVEVAIQAAARRARIEGDDFIVYQAIRVLGRIEPPVTCTNLTLEHASPIVVLEQPEMIDEEDEDD